MMHCLMDSRELGMANTWASGQYFLIDASNVSVLARKTLRIMEILAVTVPRPASLLCTVHRVEVRHACTSASFISQCGTIEQTPKISVCLRSGQGDGITEYGATRDWS